MLILGAGCVHHTPLGAALPRTLRERAPSYPRLFTSLHVLCPYVVTDISW